MVTGNTDVVLKMNPWTRGVSPAPNSRPQLQQGEETRKEQWDLVQPFIHLSRGEQTRVAQLRRACAPRKPVRGNYCLLLVLKTIPEAPAKLLLWAILITGPAPSPSKS